MRRYIKIGSALLAGLLLCGMATAAWAENTYRAPEADEKLHVSETTVEVAPRNIAVYPTREETEETKPSEVTMRVNEQISLIAITDGVSDTLKTVSQEDLDDEADEENGHTQSDEDIDALKSTDDEEDDADASEDADENASDDEDVSDEDASEDEDTDADADEDNAEDADEPTVRKFTAASREKYNWRLSDDSDGGIIEIAESGDITAKAEGKVTVVASYTETDEETGDETTYDFRCDIVVKSYLPNALYVPYDGNMELGDEQKVDISFGELAETEDTAKNEDDTQVDAKKAADAVELDADERAEILKSIQWKSSDTSLLTVQQNDETGEITVKATDTVPQGDDPYETVELIGTVSTANEDDEPIPDEVLENSDINEQAQQPGITYTYEIWIWKTRLEGAQPGAEITLDEDNMLLLREGEAMQLAVDAKPDRAYLGAVTWKSSDESVVTVDPETGEIKAVGVGNARVTAEAKKKLASKKSQKPNPVRYVFHVQVLPNAKVSSITLNRQRITLEEKATFQLEATIEPEAAASTPIIWSSSSSANASVNSNGLITAMRASNGTVKITATVKGKDDERERSAVCEVMVVDGSNTTDEPNNGNQGNTGNTGNTGTTTRPVSGGIIYNGGSTFPNTGSLYMPGSLVSLADRSEPLYVMPTHIPRSVFLTVDSALDTETQSILTALSAFGGKATFFVPVENLYESDDLLRQIAGGGHSIGLLLQPEQARSMRAAVELLDDANERLTVITGTPSRIVRIAGGSSGVLDADDVRALQKAGYRVWDWDKAANESAADTASVYQSLVTAMDVTGTTAIRFDGTANSAAVLQQLLPYMQYCGIPSRAISAGDTPTCQVPM